jgi:hypothetical protein
VALLLEVSFWRIINANKFSMTAERQRSER